MIMFFSFLLIYAIGVYIVYMTVVHYYGSDEIDGSFSGFVWPVLVPCYLFWLLIRSSVKNINRSFIRKLHSLRDRYNNE